MIQVAHSETNPPKVMQDFIAFLAEADLSKASRYAQMDKSTLSQTYHEEADEQNRQILLMQHLKQQIQRFAQPDIGKE